MIDYMGKPLFTWNGGKDSTTQSAPTSDSVYRIGSVSKLFAWLLALIAEAKGLINMHDPVKKSVPDLELIDMFFPADARNMYTWHHLAAHMAGMPREAPCQILNCTHTTTEMLARLRNSFLKLPPGTTPYYSNLGYSLLGRLISDRVFNTGESYEQLVHRLILKPLQMDNTTFSAPSSFVAPNPPQPIIDFKWSSPTGQMFSTARDMQKLSNYISESSRQFFTFGNPYNPFSRSQASKTRPSKLNTLSQEPNNILGIRNDRLRASMFADFENTDSTGLSAPWQLSPVDNYIIRQKGGNVNSYSASSAVIPELRLSLTFLTNQALDESAWVQSIFSQVVPDLTKVLGPLQNVPSPPKNADLYTGTYDSTAGNALIRPDLMGNLILSAPIIGNVVLVPASFDPNNAKILQVYIPDANVLGGLPCTTRELLSLSYEVVHFEIDAGRAKSFTIPGFIYGFFWRR